MKRAVFSKEEMDRLVKEAIDKEREKIYDAGWNEGYDKGYDKGYDDGVIDNERYQED